MCQPKDNLMIPHACQLQMSASTKSTPLSQCQFELNSQKWNLIIKGEHLLRKDKNVLPYKKILRWNNMLIGSL